MYIVGVMGFVGLAIVGWTTALIGAWSIYDGAWRGAIAVAGGAVLASWSFYVLGRVRTWRRARPRLRLPDYPEDDRHIGGIDYATDQRVLHHTLHALLSPGVLEASALRDRLAEIAEGVAPGSTRLYILDDGAQTWISAKSAERVADIYVRCTGSRPDEWDDEPPEVSEVEYNDARKQRFIADDGNRISMWEAFEIVRGHECIIASSEY